MSRLINIPPRPMRGATAGVAGASGYVPTPAAGKENSYLRGDGTWAGINGLVNRTTMPANTAATGAVGDFAVSGDTLAIYVASVGWVFFTGFQV